MSMCVEFCEGNKPPGLLSASSSEFFCIHLVLAFVPPETPTIVSQAVAVFPSQVLMTAF